jgi:hypothetical protein
MSMLLFKLALLRKDKKENEYILKRRSVKHCNALLNSPAHESVGPKKLHV